MLLEVGPGDPGSEARAREIVRGIERRMAEVESVGDPFPHFLCGEIIAPEVLTALLDWLDAHGVWEVLNQGFYSLHRCVNLREIVESPVRSLVERPVIEAFAAQLARIFGVKVGTRWIYVATNRMTFGQSIATHADPPDQGGENVRLVMHLGRPREPVEGGELLLLREKDDEFAVTGVSPVHGAAAGFVLTRRSFHAVNKVLAGTRNTLVLGFYEDGRIPDELRGGETSG